MRVLSLLATALAATTSMAATIIIPSGKAIELPSTNVTTLNELVNNSKPDTGGREFAAGRQLVSLISTCLR